MLSDRTLRTVSGMRINPAKERAAAPARRLEELLSFGRDEEVEVAEEEKAGVRGGMSEALWRMALRLVK